jgi:predicted nucleotidyltransferase
MMDRDQLLDRVRNAVRVVEPDAEIILYGSRARGDETDDSDWDFLVLVDGSLDERRTDKIRHCLYEIEWECGEVLSCIVRTREEWESSLYKTLPLYKIVKSHGITL